MREPALSSPPNRLVREKSPYLLQHARNPVDWYPWGPEAFAEARRRDCPIVLSIGYATCHWCHVMARESFEDPTVAAVMNRYFVNVKVDREERPDIDAVYMAAVNAFTGSGGWPLNVFLTPLLQPFFGGTYFPPAPRRGIVSWTDLLKRIAALWDAPDQRRRIVGSAARLTAALRQPAATEERGAPTRPMSAEAVHRLRAAFDVEWGGFGAAPKFPMPPLIAFLLRKDAPAGDADEGDPSAVDMGLMTLDAISRGGIRDHIGGGFHRYATDRRWHVPHFEKMLYDNAQLAATYAHAFSRTGDTRFRTVTEETIAYVLRDLGHIGGGFHSAEDADSAPPEDPAADSEEGAFYLWTMTEIEGLLLPEESGVFMARYGVQPEGNVIADPHGEFSGKNVLYAARSIVDIAAKRGIEAAAVNDMLRHAREKLFAARCHRPRPRLDDKILTEWNALMISALARSSVLMENPAWLREAARAADFLRANLYDAEHRQLYRRWRQGQRRVPAMAADHAHLVDALLALFDAGQKPHWLAWAMELAETLLTQFFDAGAGAFRMADANTASELIVNPLETSDGVMPSANAAAASALLRLGRLLHEPRFCEAAERAMDAQAPRIARHPTSQPLMLSLLDTAATPPLTVFIAGAASAPDTAQMLSTTRRHTDDAAQIVLVDSPEMRALLGPHLPAVDHMVPLSGRATAYVCIGTNCMAPENDPDKLVRLLTRARPGG